MPSFKVISDISEIQLGPEWVDSPNFQSKCVKVKGRKFKIVAKKECPYSFGERLGRILLGVLGLMGLPFGTVSAKTIKKLFANRVKKARFGIELSNMRPPQGYTTPTFLPDAFDRLHRQNNPSQPSTPTQDPRPRTGRPTTHLPGVDSENLSPDVDKAIRQIKERYSDYKTRDENLIKLTESYILRKDLESAYKAAKSLDDSFKRGQFAAKLAQEAYQSGDMKKAYELIKDSYVDGTVRGEFAAKLAQEAYRAGDKEKAYELIKDSYVDSEVRGEFAAKLAQEAYQAGDKEKAYKLIKDSYVDSKVRGEFAAKLAQEAYQAGDKEKAYELIKDSYVDSKVRGRFAAMLAEDAYQAGDKEKAHDLIKDSYVDSNVKVEFIIQLTQDYYTERNYEKAVKVIDDACIPYETKENWLLKIAKIYREQGSQDKIIQLLQIYIQSRIIEKIAERVGSGNKNYPTISELVRNREQLREKAKEISDQFLNQLDSDHPFNLVKQAASELFDAWEKNKASS
jgi:uncharacterized protein HemY